MELENMQQYIIVYCNLKLRALWHYSHGMHQRSWVFLISFGPFIFRSTSPLSFQGSGPSLLIFLTREDDSVLVTADW